MALVDSLLTAIVRVDGDALVLHAGERPYVVAPSGQSEIASRVLTLDAMVGMLGELLPGDARRSLDEFGAVKHELPPSTVSEEGFTVVAARGGDDIWIEIRRHRKIVAPPEPVKPEPIAQPEPPPQPKLPPQPEAAQPPVVRPEKPKIVEPEPDVHEIRSDVHELSFDEEDEDSTYVLNASDELLELPEMPRTPESANPPEPVKARRS